MSSHPHPIVLLKKHVASRDTAIKHHLATAARLPKRHPAVKAHQAAADRLTTEASALRAALQFQKTPELLARDIEQQQIKVEYLLKAWKGSRGMKKVQISRQMQKENLRLREMLAAAKLKAIVPPTVAEEQAVASDLPSVSLVPDYSPIVDAAAAQAAVASEGPRLFPDDPRDPFITTHRSHERFWSRIGGLDESGYSGDVEPEPRRWSKSPLVIIGCLAALWFVSTRSPLRLP